MFRSSRIAAAAIVGLVTFAVVASVVALTAGNTVPDTRAGAGTGTVSGYTVTNVHYVINATDRTKVDSVTFVLDAEPVAGSAVSIRLSPTGNWYSCTSAGTAASCATTSPQVSVQGVTELTVVVAQ